MSFILFVIILSLAMFFLYKAYPKIYKYLIYCIFVTLITIMVFLIILYPEEIIKATRRGIVVWFQSVLPSLLPFFIGAELLIGLGVVKFIGVLIEPLVRPMFNVPGEASFIFAMSITSGYPMGIKLTSDLRKKNSITKVDAQRIISFCSTSGPLFMIGAVSIGMFNNPMIGPYIALAHYISAITVGIIFRFYGETIKLDNIQYTVGNKNILYKAFNEMIKARKKDGRPFGKLLSDSVQSAISTIVMVGGFIVLFSVVIEEIRLIGFLNILKRFIQLTSLDNIISSEIIEVLFTGFVEITMGCKGASQLNNTSIISQIVICTMIISWSGISVHAQAASMLNETDINIKTYIISKFMHSIISGIYVYALIKLSKYKSFLSQQTVFNTYGVEKIEFEWLDKMLFSSKIFITIIITLLLLGIIKSLFPKKVPDSY